MFGLKKSPLNKFGRHKSVDPGYPSSNPFESNNESGDKYTLHASNRTSSESDLTTTNLKSNLFDNYDKEGIINYSSSSSSYSNASARNKYKNDFHDSGGFENQSVQELESYAVYKAEETTKSVNNCLKIAEDIRENASNTLVTLHQQGEQITRTHMIAANIDHDLSRGEKLLGSLGGMFSKTWKPKKTRPITGPVMTRDDSFIKRSNHLEQQERLGLNLGPKGRSYSRTPPPEPTNALQQVEVEKSKQDDALSDLSNILGELKGMAVDMGSEIERQNKGMDHIYNDVDELNFRVKGANERGRRLLGK